MSGGTRSRCRRALLVALAFAVRFLFVAAVITVAVFVSEALGARFGEDKGAIAAVMLVVVVFLSLALTVMELLARRITAERPAARIAEMAERLAAGDVSVRALPAHAYGSYDVYDKIGLDLERVAARLAAAARAGNDFISNVSHELKTPLAVIVSYAQALEKPLPDDTRAEYLAVLRQEAEKLAALVQGVLRLNRLEQRKSGTVRAEVDLREQLAGCILQFEDAMEQKGLSLTCDLAEVRVCSDAECLELVWNNLLSNAVKFTDRGGIRVTLAREGAHAVVTVSDTGCGISAETGAHIFEQFYQGDTSHAREGNGLGLALVKKVISVLGGTIGVESEEGKGSTFRVTLPLHP